MVDRLLERPVGGAVTKPLRPETGSLPEAVAPQFSYALHALLRVDLGCGIPSGEQLIAHTSEGVHKNNFIALDDASLRLRSEVTLSEAETTDRNIAYFTTVFSALRRLDVESEQFSRRVLGIFGIQERTLVYDYPSFIQSHGGENAIEQTVHQIVAALNNPVDILRARSFLSGIKFFRLFGNEEIAQAIEACLEVEATKGEAVPMDEIVVADIARETQVVHTIAGDRVQIDESVIAAIGQAIKDSSAPRPIPAEFFSQSLPWTEAEDDEELGGLFGTIGAPVIIPRQADLVGWTPLYRKQWMRFADQMALEDLFLPQDDVDRPLVTRSGSVTIRRRIPA